MSFHAPAPLEPKPRLAAEPRGHIESMSRWRVEVEGKEERLFFTYSEATGFFRDAVLAGAKRVRMTRVPSRWESILWTLRRIAWTPLTLLCLLRVAYYRWKYREAEVPLTLPC